MTQGRSIRTTDRLLLLVRRHTSGLSQSQISVSVSKALSL
jgi:hypothetical protein